VHIKKCCPVVIEKFFKWEMVILLGQPFKTQLRNWIAPESRTSLRTFFFWTGLNCFWNSLVVGKYGFQNPTVLYNISFRKWIETY
jgi:hypothetical protein